MAQPSTSTAMAVKIESVAGTFSAPSSTTDLMPVAELRPTINGITVDNPEYTGSIHAKGPTLIGKTVELSGRIMLRGPGGSAPPALDAWPQGRILRASGFAESRLAAAIPVAPEAIGASPSVTQITLGVSAAGTLGLYKGLPVHISDMNANYFRAMSMIRSYSAAKVAVLGDTLGAVPAANYQIPMHLAYLLAAGDPPTLSVSAWFGNKRWDVNGMAISACSLNLPVSGRESASDLPSINFTLSGELQAIADATPPSIPSQSAIPAFKDGKMYVSGIPLGGSSLSIDLGATVAFPPNPNRVSGSDPGQLVRTERTGSLQLNQVAQTVINFDTLADAQAFHAIEAMYGLGNGNFIGFIAPEVRFNHQSPDSSGNFVTTSGEFWIDDVDKSIGLVFPYS